MPSQYWLVSLPLKGSSDNTWRLLHEKVGKVAFDTTSYKLNIPDLRVGTLDSLLALSDDLVKANTFIESVAIKIRRQIEELDRTSGTDSGSLTVEGLPIDSYITRFTWDEAKYPVMSTLRETVDTIHESVAKIEDDLKVRVSEYNAVKSQLAAINRKAAGSMLVRDLTSVVKAEDIVNSEHMVTLLVVISKFMEKDWLTTYESLSTFVVPRSSKKLTEDNEYALFTVTLFRRVADAFKVSAREKGFQVREYEHDPEGAEQRKLDQERLAHDQEAMRSSLLQWCHVGYGEVFSSWAHVCTVRVFAESILRYGLPPAFLASVIVPSPRTEKRLRDALDTLCSAGNSAFWKGENDMGMAGLAGGDAETHPYVSITMNLGG